MFFAEFNRYNIDHPKFKHIEFSFSILSYIFGNKLWFCRLWDKHSREYYFYSHNNKFSAYRNALRQFNNNMEFQTLLIKFAQVNGLKYEETLSKANRIIDGGWNELMGWGIKIEGGSKEERQESLKKELEKKFA